MASRLTIRKSFKRDGVLADPDSVVLSDESASFGVRQASTGTVVVPAGTPMTRLSVGVYEYALAVDEVGQYDYCLAVNVGGDTSYFGDGITVAETALSLAAVRDWLRLDHSDDDAVVLSLLASAEAFVQAETSRDFAENPPDELLGVAIKQIVALWYENREAATSLAMNRLPFALRSIILKYRAFPAVTD